MEGAKPMDGQAMDVDTSTNATADPNDQPMEDAETQPVATIPLTQGPDIPEKLQNILEILQAHKTKLIEDSTLTTQSPDANVSINIKRHGEILLNALFNNTPANDDIKEVIKSILNFNTPWDPTVSTMTREYIEMLYIQCPLSITAEHCERMKKDASNYSLLSPDGTPTEMPPQSY